MSNGNFDGYGGITDSLLSETGKERENSGKGGSSDQVQLQNHQRTSDGGAGAGGGGPGGNGGPLLDFKSAFSDIDSKPSDLRYADQVFYITQFDLTMSTQPFQFPSRLARLESR